MDTFAGFSQFPTHHCITGAMRRLYEAQGCPVSEDLLLGLGAGVGFIYWHMKGMLPFMGGRANVGRPGEEGLEQSAACRTGVQVSTASTGSSKKAAQELLSHLTARESVMLMVDMGYLPYFDFPEEYHFGGHAVVTAGFDVVTNDVLLADRESTFFPVSWDILARARASKYKPFPPQHKYFQFDCSTFQPPAADEVMLAIQQVVTGMLQPPISNLGVRGIHKAAEIIPNWVTILDDVEEVMKACFNAFIFIDATGGTGGGIFRYMYGRFLHEAAALTGKAPFCTIGDSFQQIGDRWQDVAALLKEASSSAENALLLAEIGQRLHTVAAQEETAWEALRSVVSAE